MYDTIIRDSQGWGKIFEIHLHFWNSPSPFQQKVDGECELELLSLKVKVDGECELELLTLPKVKGESERWGEKSHWKMLRFYISTCCLHFKSG